MSCFYLLHVTKKLFSIVHTLADIPVQVKYSVQTGSYTYLYILTLRLTNQNFSLLLTKENKASAQKSTEENLLLLEVMCFQFTSQEQMEIDFFIYRGLF